MLMQPIPFKGELDNGYLGRVMRLNSCLKESEIDQLMAKYVGLDKVNKREVSRLELLSATAQIDTEEFAKNHTTLPFRRGITSYFPYLIHGSKEKSSMLRTTAMRSAKPGAYCCSKCIEQDLETIGISYWRRKHQLPGLFWCPDHNTPLNFIEDEKSFLKAPEEVLHRSTVISNSWLGDAIDNKLINSYLKISFSLLEKDKPISVASVMPVLKERAAKLGFQTHGGKVKYPLLSDAIVNIYGKEWLSTVQPTLALKNEGEILSQMDGVLYLSTSSSSVSAYILALSTLFESSEEALQAIDRGAEVNKRHRAKPVCLDNASLRSAYIESHGSYSKCMALLNSNYQQVSQKLRKMGLPNIKEDQLQRIEQAAHAFYENGESVEASARIGSITTKELEEFIRMSGPSIVRTLQEMRKPLSGRGSGKRRPMKFSPDEIESVDESQSYKFSKNIRREQKLVEQRQAEEEEVAL